MPRSNTSTMTDALRTKALDHPTVARLTEQLPSLPRDGSPKPGLYVETKETPGLVVNGELRVSVARLFTADEEGKHLVGQIQAVRSIDHPLATWEIRTYTHTPEHFHTEHVDDHQAWFMNVLESHYSVHDAQPQLETGVQA